MAHRSFSRRDSIALALLGLCAVGLFWWIFFSGQLFELHSRNAPERAALVAIQNDIELGTARPAVEAAFTKHATPRMKLRTDDANEWIVSMPLEFGAGDWVLFIGFENGEVSSVCVRTMDGPAPRDGPPDKGETRKRR